MGDSFAATARSRRSRASIGPGERPLVRQDDALARRVEADARDEAAPGAADPVRTDELLLEPPDGGTLVPRRARLRSCQAAIALGGQRGLVRPDQPNDVVRARGDVALELDRRDDVVGRRDQRVERPGRPHVVAQGAKRLHAGPRGASLASAASGLDSSRERRRPDRRARRGSARRAASSRSRGSSACARAPVRPYLALELVDPTGRIDARVWNDVELLDQRFDEGDAVRVLGRVERFRDRLQLDVRSLEKAEVDPGTLVPECHGAIWTSSTASSSSSRPRSRTPGWPRASARFARRRRVPRAPAARCRRPRTATTLRGRPARAHGQRRHALPRDGRRASAAAQRPPRSPPRSCTTSAGSASSTAARSSCRPHEGRLLGHVHLGLRLIEERAAGPRPTTCAPSCCTRSRSTTTRAPRTRPRRPCSTTRTSSTRSPPRGPSRTRRAGSHGARAALIRPRPPGWSGLSGRRPRAPLRLLRGRTPSTGCESDGRKSRPGDEAASGKSITRCGSAS